MSDLQAAFRAAKAQKGGQSNAKEQLKALRAQKLAQKGASTIPGDRKTPASELDAQPALKKQAIATPAPSVSAAPSASASASQPRAPTGSAAVAAAVLPAGFFADKTDDAKARGMKIPDKKDKEQEFREFQKQLDDQVKEIAAKEAEEAATEAAEREDREEFEQLLRMDKLDSLKAKMEGGPLSSSVPGSYQSIEVEVPKPVLPARRMSVVQQLKADEESGEDTDGDSDGDDEGILNWRAKTV